MKDKESKKKTRRTYDIEEPLDYCVTKTDPIEYNGKKLTFDLDIIEDGASTKASAKALKQLIAHLAIAKKKTPLEVLREMRYDLDILMEESKKNNDFKDVDLFNKD